MKRDKEEIRKMMEERRKCLEVLLDQGKLIVNFNYNHPHEPTLTVIRPGKVEMYVLNRLVGDEAVVTYSKLTGMDVDEVLKLAGDVPSKGENDENDD